MAENVRITFPAREEVTLTNEPIPEPGADEVLIRTERTLISTGTELMMLTDSRPGQESALPFTPGYNNVGEIIECGDDVPDEVIGRRVATYGRHARFTVRAAEACYHVPDIPIEEAVFFTIAEIVMNGVRRGRVRFGEAVAVFGLGLLGQLTVRLAHLAGAYPVVGLDIADDRLQYLPEDPGIVTLNPDDDGWIETIEAATGGREIDVAFEVTGRADVIPDEFAVLGDRGRFVVLGSPRGSSRFDFNRDCHFPGHEIIGAHNRTHPGTATAADPWTRARHVELFFEFVEAGRLSVADLVTHREPYDRAPTLYRDLLADRTAYLGVVLEW